METDVADVVGPLDHDQVAFLLLEHDLVAIEREQGPGVVGRLLVGLGPGDDVDLLVDVLLEELVGIDQVELVVLLQELGVGVGEALEMHRGRVDLLGDVAELHHSVGADLQLPRLAHHAVAAVVDGHGHAFLVVRRLRKPAGQGPEPSGQS